MPGMNASQPRPPIEPSNATGPPVRYGIIGTGMMGGEHLLDLAHIADAQVVALSDPVASSLEWGVACTGHAVATYTDHRDLIARDDLDAVVIASPNHTHASLLDDILATDLAVLVEKPMCTTVEDALRVRRLADGRDALTWVGLEYRYIPTVSVLLDQLATGVCGTTRMVSIREHRFPFLVKVGNWNRFTANTGGTLVEKCCHFFDLMRLAAGADPVRVMASGGQDVNHLDEVYDGRVPDILDNAYVIVEFANGVRGALDLSMFAEGGRYEQEITIVGDAAKLEATVPGDRVFVGPRDRSGVREVDAPTPADVPYPEFHSGSSYLEHLRFIDCLRAGRAAEVTVDDGLWSVVMGAAAHRSIDERRIVEISEYDLG
ncbi:MAG: scyllo-inositol 2-dehydrogenase [Actinomycetota bacterium]|jgi:myo-inositol 2-dehydrogenase/D-chiro-inositol 1-dehydrogenase